MNGARQLLDRSADEELVKLTREGSEAAFAALDSRYRRALLSYCQRLLGDLDTAEDAVQQVFFAAYRSLIADDRPIQLAPWLFTIAHNQCITFVRRRREQPLDEIEPVSDDVCEQLLRRLALAQVVRDLQQLPDDQRLALSLTAFGVSSAEIAPLLGVRTEKIRALVFQGREALMKISEAREIACTTIRSELMSGQRGAIRRSHVHRHLHECDSCRAYARRRRRRPPRTIPRPGAGEVSAAAA